MRLNAMTGDDWMRIIGGWMDEAVTCLDGCDVGSSGVPVGMETKVSAAVGLLVQTDAHVAETLL